MFSWMFYIYISIWLMRQNESHDQFSCAVAMCTLKCVHAFCVWCRRAWTPTWWVDVESPVSYDILRGVFTPQPCDVRTCLPNPVQVVLTGWKPNLTSHCFMIWSVHIYIFSKPLNFLKAEFLDKPCASPWPRACLLPPITNAGQSSVRWPSDDQATATSGEIGELFGIGGCIAIESGFDGFVLSKLVWGFLICQPSYMLPVSHYDHII